MTADVGSTEVVDVTAKAWSVTTSVTSAPTGVVTDASAPPAPTPPTSPTNVHVTSVSTTAINVAWGPSTAAGGLAGYDLYRNGTPVGTSMTTTATFSGLSCGTTANLAVDAYDNAGTKSTQSAVTASTAACPPPADTQPPTAPANLRVAAATTTSLSLAWDPSTDNVGVTGYAVYQNGASVTAVVGTTATLAGLSCGTTYTVGVDATDAASNRSAQTSISATTAACATPPPPSWTSGLMTGAHWGTASDLSTFKQIGYGFDVATCQPTDLAGCTALLDTAHADGLKLIIGGYPEPYTLNADGTWSISAAGVQMLQLFQQRAADVLAVFVFNEPYWVDHYTAAQLRAIRAKIRTVWPQAPVYQDLGQPSCWVSGGGCQGSGPQYDDQSGVCDYCGIWDYPFTTSGYTKTQSLAIAQKESAFVLNSIHGIPVWLNQAHAASCCNLVMPTQAQVLDWNCAVRKVLPPGSLVSWYVWRQGIYSDQLANHPEDWPDTTASICL
jgi:chitodextrinase